MKCFIKYFCVLSIFVVTMSLHSFTIDAEVLETTNFGEITVNLLYKNEPPGSNPGIRIHLLTDNDDLFSHIESLKEESKAELEPLVKQYMYTAEVLTRLARKNEPDQNRYQPEARVRSDFKKAEKDIHTILGHYTTIIASLLRQHNVQTFQDMPLSSEHVTFSDLAPGKYRVYAVLTFSTTTLTWFEPIAVKGGGRHIVRLTRENMSNPYWTELNWWSFMNLDFSKHH